MTENEPSSLVQEILFLMKIPSIKRSVEAMLEQQKEIFKDQVNKLIQEQAERVTPMPTAESREYFFQATRNPDTGIWENKVGDNFYNLPVNSLLPMGAIMEMEQYEIKPEVNYHLEYSSSHYKYNFHFNRFTANHIAGTGQRVATEEEDASLPIAEIDHYLDLTVSEMDTLFRKYYESHPELKKEILLEFFTRILPRSEFFKKQIS
jgi:hypothetical protein